MSLDIFALCNYLRGLPREEARQVSHDLSVAASEAHLKLQTFVTLPAQYTGTDLARLYAKARVTPSMVSAPWKAYLYTNSTPEEVAFSESTGRIRILATYPRDYSLIGETPDNYITGDVDSLVLDVARLIGEAREDLLIVMPYWSIPGVDVIQSRMDTGKRPNLKVTLMTPPPDKMEYGDKEGVKEFILMMERSGARVNHRYPRPLESGEVPLVHAKVVISDKKEAYLGSANLSRNGMRVSIEAGVSLSGTEALWLHNWFTGINSNFRSLE